MTDSEALYVKALEQQLQSLREMNEMQTRQIDRLTQLLEQAGII